MIKLQLIGNLGRDAAVRQIENEQAISFNVAVNEKYTNKQGVKVENTQWVECTIWRKSTESVKIAEFLKKGTQVFIEGKPSVDTYKNKEGLTVATLKVRVLNVELLGGSKNQDAAAPAAEPAAEPSTNGMSF